MLRAKGSNQLIVTRDDKILAAPPAKPTENAINLVTLVHKDDQYWVYHKQSLYRDNGDVDFDFKHNEQVWQVIKLSNIESAKKLRTADQIRNANVKMKHPNQCMKLSQGDVIKFGRVRFCVKKISINRK